MNFKINLSCLLLIALLAFMPEAFAASILTSIDPERRDFDVQAENTFDMRKIKVNAKYAGGEDRLIDYTVKSVENGKISGANFTPGTASSRSKIVLSYAEGGVEKTCVVNFYISKKEPGAPTFQAENKPENSAAKVTVTSYNAGEKKEKKKANNKSRDELKNQTRIVNKIQIQEKDISAADKSTDEKPLNKSEVENSKEPEGAKISKSPLKSENFLEEIRERSKRTKPFKSFIMFAANRDCIMLGKFNPKSGSVQMARYGFIDQNWEGKKSLGNAGLPPNFAADDCFIDFSVGESGDMPSAAVNKNSSETIRPRPIGKNFSEETGGGPAVLSEIKEPVPDYYIYCYNRVKKDIYFNSCKNMRWKGWQKGLGMVADLLNKTLAANGLKNENINISFSWSAEVSPENHWVTVWQRPEAVGSGVIYINDNTNQFMTEGISAPENYDSGAAIGCAMYKSQSGGLLTSLYCYNPERQTLWVYENSGSGNSWKSSTISCSGLQFAP